MHVSKEQMKRIKTGDQQAFRTLVEQHQQYAFSLAFRILCNEDEAKDAVQESFIKIWKHIDAYKPDMKFTTWIYKIVTNSAIDRLRSHKRINTVPIDIMGESLGRIQNHNPEEQADNEDLARLIRAIAQKLPITQRLIFILRDIHGFPSEEVECILDLPENSVKSNLYHARKAVREKIKAMVSYGITYKGSHHGM